jgi:hypothetical protein
MTCALAAGQRGVRMLYACARESERGVPYALFGEMFSSSSAVDDESNLEPLVMLSRSLNEDETGPGAPHPSPAVP